MVRNDIKNSSLLKTKFLIYAFNGRTEKKRLVANCLILTTHLKRNTKRRSNT